jgi:hypothetical protein
MRRVLEAVVTHPGHTPPDVLASIWQYTKLFWIHTGPFNNLTARKFVPSCTPEAFEAAVHEAVRAGASLPLEDGESVDVLLARLRQPFFDRGSSRSSRTRRRVMGGTSSNRAPTTSTSASRWPTWKHSPSAIR